MKNRKTLNYHHSIGRTKTWLQCHKETKRLQEKYRQRIIKFWFIPVVCAFSRNTGYGCSFVAKLSWKKLFFFEKIFVFFTKYTLFAEKNSFIWKKIYIDFFFFFAEKVFIENEKNVYLIWERFFYPENIYSAKKFFDYRKYIC